MSTTNKLQAGSEFPSIAVPKAGGGEIKVGGSGGWQMLVVYRGKHCPQCRRYLKVLGGLLDDYKAAGVSIAVVSGDPKEKAEAEIVEESWQFPVGYGLTPDQMRTLGLYISNPRSPEETDRPFPEPGLFVVNPEGRAQIIDISNAPWSRPGKGEQFTAEFLAVSPNNRIPALVDHDPPGGGKPISVFESGAMLVYLAEKTGQFLPPMSQPDKRADTMQWLFWQMGGLGPMSGQNNHFSNYAVDKIPYAMDRYRNEVNRLYGVMNRRLADRPYLAGEYSIADMASYPWVVPHERQGQKIGDFPHLKRWFDAIAERPAVKKAYELVAKVNPGHGGIRTAEERAILFGQTAASIEQAAKAAAGGR